MSDFNVFAVKGGSQEGDEPSGICTLQFSTNSEICRVTSGLTVKAAFESKAERLSFDPSRPVTYRAGAEPIQATAHVREGVVYSAFMQAENKG